MTWSRSASKAAMVRAAGRGELVAAGSAGFDDKFFAAEFAQVVGGVADGVSGDRVHLGDQIGDGEAAGCGGIRAVPMPAHSYASNFGTVHAYSTSAEK
ncbi:MAG: hypothetical protein ACRDTH_10630 [Pseudonocardiaceae bacterium]